MKAVGYSRVSTHSQSLGIEAQQANIAEYAAKAGIPCVQFVDCAVEGTTPIDERPGLLGALSSLTKGDVLVCARYDRLGRDVILSTVIEREVSRRGCKTISCAGEASGVEGPGGEMVRTILFAMAAYERALVALRTRSALKALRARGFRAGAVPYGYDLAAGESGGKQGSRLVANDSERSTLRTIFAMRSAGIGYREVARRLNAVGTPPKRGVVWHGTSVRSVERTAIAAGLVAPTAPRLTG